jgi:hypothetical protein
MATHDDDYLSSSVPPPDAESTPAERAHAKTFADIVDKAIAGRAPVAMSADDRALLEVATVIRAAHGGAQLPADKQRSIVEDALRQAVGEGLRARGGVTPIATARRRWMPWTIAAVSTVVAAAAVLLLWLRAPLTEVHVRETAAVPTSWTSRPADPLIGPIAREHAGDASSRIDYLFADRLDGFRERRLTPVRRSKP